VFFTRAKWPQCPLFLDSTKNTKSFKHAPTPFFFFLPFSFDRRHPDFPFLRRSSVVPLFVAWFSRKLTCPSICSLSHHAFFQGLAGPLFSPPIFPFGVGTPEVYFFFEPGSKHCSIFLALCFPGIPRPVFPPVRSSASGPIPVHRRLVASSFSSLLTPPPLSTFAFFFLLFSGFACCLVWFFFFFSAYHSRALTFPSPLVDPMWTPS